jgi:hypothetical protein
MSERLTATQMVNDDLPILWNHMAYHHYHDNIDWYIFLSHLLITTFIYAFRIIII